MNRPQGHKRSAKKLPNSIFLVQIIAFILFWAKNTPMQALPHISGTGNSDPIVMRRRGVMMLALIAALGSPTWAQEAPANRAPSVLSAYGADWLPKGSGPLRFFGFKAYDATLWLPAASGGSFSFNRAFALEIVYNTAVKASDINNTSLIEISRISAATPEQVQAWSTFMTGMFVDVKSGDRLLGVHVPGAGARFFLNGRLLGETPDAAFSEAFFKIWLDPKARKPELRAALLGL